MSAIKVFEKNMTDDKFNAYEKAVRQVWADGQVSLDEADMIEALRKSLNITFEEHAEIESKIRREYDQSVKEGKSFSLEAKGLHESPKATEAASSDVPAGSSPQGTQVPPNNGASTGNGGDDDIGGLSSEELSNDLDTLSKSIGELGDKVFGGESLSDRIQKEVGDATEEDESPASVGSPPGDPGGPETGGASGSSLLEKLKSQYKLDKDEGGSGGGNELGARTGEIPAPTEATPASEQGYADEEQSSMEESPLDDETLEEYLEAGKEAFREKDYKRAVSFLKKALKIESGNKEVKFFLKKVATAIKSMKRPPSESTGEGAAGEDTGEAPAPMVEEALPPEAAVDIVPIENSTVTEATGSQTDCSSCGGSGICNWCKGAVKCYWCNGTGKCTKCMGSKEIDGKPCGFCNGEGICGSCEGTGNCTWCKGSGKCSNCSS